MCGCEEMIKNLEARVARLEKIIKPKAMINITDKQKKEIIKLRKDGYSFRTIGIITGVSYSSCHRIFKEAVNPKKENFKFFKI